MGEDGGEGVGIHCQHSRDNHESIMNQIERSLVPSMCMG
jgi:hypothetical protein